MIVDKSLEGKRIKLVDAATLCELNFCESIAVSYQKILTDLTVMRIGEPNSKGAFWVSLVPSDKVSEAKYIEEDKAWDIEIPMTNAEVECFEIIEG